MNDEFIEVVEQSLAFCRGYKKLLRRDFKTTPKWNLVKRLKISKEIIRVLRRIITLHNLIISHIDSMKNKLERYV